MLRERFSGGSNRAAKLTYIHVCPRTDHTSDHLTPLGFFLLSHVKRTGEDGIDEVIVQELLEILCVPLFKYLMPFASEFDLWRIGVGHRDKGVERVGVCVSWMR